MKQLLVLFLVLTGVMRVAGQETAMDWTRTECGSGNEHHLFAELDSGFVIIIDFVMMGCPSCITASDALSDILSEYNLSHPGKVRFYSVGFSNSTNCSVLLNWKTANGYKHPAFEKGGAETAYYGGMGMPTIVVLGGDIEHKVYYNNFGYSPSDDPAIIAAIDQAIAESNVTSSSDLSPAMQINAFPNPFTEMLSIVLTGRKASHLELADPSGRVYYRQNLDTNAFESRASIPTAELTAGVWFVVLYDGDDRLAIEKVIKE